MADINERIVEFFEVRGLDDAQAKYLKLADAIAAVTTRIGGLARGADEAQAKYLKLADAIARIGGLARGAEGPQPATIAGDIRQEMREVGASIDEGKGKIREWLKAKMDAGRQKFLGGLSVGQQGPLPNTVGAQIHHDLRTLSGAVERNIDRFKRLREAINRASSGSLRFGQQGPLRPTEAGGVHDMLRTAGGKVRGAFSSAWAGANLGMLKSFTIAGLITKAIEGAVQMTIQFARHGWDVAASFERARQRVTGMALGLIDFGKKSEPKAVVSEVDKFITSQKIANILLERFRDTAKEVGTPVSEIEKTYAAINPVLSSVGKTQLDVLNLTTRATKAAKVYGEDVAEVGKIAAKAIAEGTVEGDGALAKALKAQAQLSTKMTVEDRYKKVAAVLERMGQPLGLINRTTGSAVERWREFGDDVLRRLVEPVFTRIGGWANRILDSLGQNGATIDDLVGSVREWLDIIMNVGGAIWDVGAGIIGWLWSFGRITPILSTVWKIIGFVLKGVDIMALGLEGLLAAINSDDKGFGKLLAIGTAIEVKFREIVGAAMEIGHAVANIFADDKSLKLLGMDPGKYERVWKGDTETLAGTLRRQEKAAGLDPLSETSKRLKEIENGAGLSKAKQDEFLAKQKGLKVTQNIGTINIQQDFRDQDPDAIMIRFTRGLERLGESSLQSTAGGAATAFEATY